MQKLRLGQIQYLNCFPVHYGLRELEFPLPHELVVGPPTYLNQRFWRGELDISPLSSIEYARHVDSCLLLPNMSICANGKVKSILLFTKVPVTELEGKKVVVPDSSATAVVLLKILLEHYYHVEVEYTVAPPALESMLADADGALLIGDDALKAGHQCLCSKAPWYITDLGEAWKQLTGEEMVYAVWAVQPQFAATNPQAVDEVVRFLGQAKDYGHQNIPALVKEAQKLQNLPEDMLEEYFNSVICHDFGSAERHALLTFYDYAYKSGLIDDRVQLHIWGEQDD